MGKKVLIIDDEREMVNYLSRKLATQNFEPLVAYDDSSGLEIMAQQKVDVVITDNVMPDMDGYTFCRKLKESKALSDIPIVVCTAHANAEKQFRKLGIDDYIVKPFKFDYLFASLDRILNQTSHDIKFKKILVQANQTQGINAAIEEIEKSGFRVDVLIIPEDRNIIEEMLRYQSDILIFNALYDDKSPEILITSLKSYVELRDLKIILYVNRCDLDDQQQDIEIYLQKFREQCLNAGADGWIESLDRESFLDLLFKYCKG